ncbi:MAG: zinc-binding dehydrogenase [Acidobacteria bacterium]|nr:zinc-binding dehydrogenase [Acidobacteriota bacterium]
MKALCLEQPGRVALLDVEPAQPGPGDVLVQVAACGICHTDLHYIDHGVPTFKTPVILGHEVSGTVAACGPEVDKFRPGDPVLLPAVFTCGVCRNCRTGRENICERMRMLGNHLDGGFADYVVAPAKDCFPLPPEIPLAEACLIGDALSTPYHAVKHRARVRVGETVAVFGCGGVGINAVQFAALAGAHVIAVDIDDRKLEWARRFGARDTLNPRSVERVEKELKKRTRGGVDIAMEVIGKPETLRAAYDSLRPGGRLCVVGYCAEPVTLAFSKTMFFELEIVGSLGCRPGDYPELIELVRSGRVQLEPLVTGRYPLEEIFQGFEALRRGEGLRGIVLPGERRAA